MFNAVSVKYPLRQEPKASTSAALVPTNSITRIGTEQEMNWDWILSLGYVDIVVVVPWKRRMKLE